LLAAQEVALQSGSRAESQLFLRPELFVVKIRHRATSPVPGKSGFTAVRIEDATTKISFVCLRFRYDRDPIAACAVMPVADTPRKLTKISGFTKLVRLDHEIVVSEAVEFSELWVHRYSVALPANEAIRTVIGSMHDDRGSKSRG